MNGAIKSFGAKRSLDTVPFLIDIFNLGLGLAA